MKFPTTEEFAKQVAERVKEEITINGMPLFEFIERLNGDFENNNCNLTTCRYSQDSKCTNEEKWKNVLGPA